MNSSVEVRNALEIDARDVAELIYRTSLECCFTADQPCPAWFKASVSASQIEKLINNENMVWLVAVVQSRLVGVLAISEKSHVKYFFVDPAYQKLGIGKNLWKIASQKGVLGDSLTVRSSLNAVPIYERLGFISVGYPEIFNGLYYQAMVAKYG